MYNPNLDGRYFQIEDTYNYGHIISFFRKIDAIDYFWCKFPTYTRIVGFDEMILLDQNNPKLNILDDDLPDLTDVLTY